MQVRIGETRQEKQHSGTFDSVTVSAILKHKSENTGIAIGDFSPDGVNVKVLLKRNNQQHIIMQDNLLLLGTFNSLLKGYHEFLEGEHLQYATDEVKEQLMRSVTLDFGGHVRIADGDELLVEVTASNACVSKNIDTSESYVEFTANRSIGYEIGLYQTSTEVITVNASQQSFNPGDNVTDIAILNFDQNDLSKPVLTNLTIGSDKYDDTWTYQQLIQKRSREFGSIGRKRYGTSIPISATSPSILEGLPFLPQCFIIYKGSYEKTDLDGVRIGCSFETKNVNASQNYIVTRKYYTDKSTVVAAISRQQKHTQENIQKLPTQTALTPADAKAA